MVWKNCKFKRIKQLSSSSSAIMESRIGGSMRVIESVFENVMSEKEEGEIMMLHHGSIMINNATFSRLVTSTISSAQRSNEENEDFTKETNRDRNGDYTVECTCSVTHSAILLKDVSGRLEDCTFVNMSNGALCISDESTMVLNAVEFRYNANDANS